MKIKLLLALAVLASFALVSSAAENRFRLFDHSDTTRKAGLHFGFENKSAEARLTVESLRMYVTIGDGREWRRLPLDRTFREDERVAVRVAVGTTGAKVYLNGVLAGESPGGFVAAKAEKARLAETERSFKGHTTYRIEQDSYRVIAGDQTVSGNLRPAIISQVSLFEFPLAQIVPMPAGADTGLVIETGFRILPVRPAHFAGAVDRYGQAAASEWPGKVHGDEDIHRAREEEEKIFAEWKRPADWDESGGLTTAGWREEPTGFFRTAKHEGKWWLISPEGNPLFYTGICVVPSLVWATTPTVGREQIWQELPPKTGLTADLWVDDPWGSDEKDHFSPHGWNLVRKYGADWKNLALRDTRRRIDAWAFSGGGKFSDREDVPGRPRIEIIKPPAKLKLVRHADVFDANIRAQLHAYLEKTVAPSRGQARLLGFSIGNEYDEIITPDETRTILESHPDSAAAKAIRAALPVSSPITGAELEKARRFYAEAYYEFLYRTMKQVAPNHLYFGFWITPGWWVNESDWDMIVKYCDVIGYDRYALKYGGDDGFILRLIEKNDKPTFVGEFSFSPWYGGERGFTRYNTFVETDRDSADGYAAYVQAAAADPRCVGIMWFQYRDGPITGWGGDGDPADLVRGESHAQGLVDVADRPKWELVKRVRETNLRLTTDRLRK